MPPHILRATLAGLALLPVPLRATNHTVNTTADEFNTPSGANVSLREALRDAAVSIGSDTINFSVSGVTLTLNSTLIVNNADQVTINAPAGGLTLSGGGTRRILSVNAGSRLILNGMTLTGGLATGAIYTSGIFSGNGGALFNDGTTTLNRCTLFGNTTPAGGAGGAIDNEGTLFIDRSTLAQNSAPTSGGAIINGGQLTLTHVTISQNSATDSGGGVFNDIGTVTVGYSIVAGNTAPQAADFYNSKTVVRSGANIIGSYLIAAPGSDSGPAPLSADPLLAPLGDYGGITRTMALKPGSPARDAAVGSTATADQRGLAMVGTPDLGAYEAGNAPSCLAYLWETLPAAASDAEHAGSADFDGDGATNEAEWNALTDPASAASFLAIGKIELSSGLLVIHFPTVTGRHYTLWQSTALDASSWENVGLAPIDGDGTARSFSVAPSPPGGVARIVTPGFTGSRYFRVQAAP